MSAGTLAQQLGYTPGFLNQLRAMVLQNKRMLPGPGAGRRRSPRAGSSVELMDYRNYVPGDDLRRLDWNVLARLDSLFVRVFRAEENLLVRIYLDVSRSMAFGQPAKFDLARSLAGALAYMGLVGYDRVETAALGGPALQYTPTATGEVGAARIWSFLAATQPHGTNDIMRHAVEAANRIKEPGLTILITDGLVDGGLTPTLRALLAMRHEVAVIQVLDREELEPTFEGDWRLTDAENPSRQVEITLTPVTAGDYRQRIKSYTQDLRDFCRKQGAAYFLLPADTPLPDAVFGLLRGTLAR
ncbi:MAG TPA: DUF58 domain-containing protein [Symbiobacteriaceae bacterium]|nr:DUF58 domain-containing protein [Symbiobacteriaceae bacterium]